MQPKLTGLIIIAIGLLWLLKNLGLADINIGKLIVTYWPVLLIIWGADSFRRKTGKNNFGGIISGIILLGLGALFLSRNLGYYEFDVTAVWKVLFPLIVIFIGWSLLRGPLKTSGGAHFAVMSGINLKSPGWKLESGSFIAFMGGADIDMTVASIPEELVELNLTAVMGGIDIRVPAGLEVEFEGTAILGGIDFLAEESGGLLASRRFLQSGTFEDGKKLVIRGTAVMGGIEIKH